MINFIKYILVNLSRSTNKIKNALKNNDVEEIEITRSIVRSKHIPVLINRYKMLNDWEKKCSIIELLQDQEDGGLSAIMLDFLRAPVHHNDERIWLAKAIALKFIDEKYNKFMVYYRDRDLLEKDVSDVLVANRLRVEPAPDEAKRTVDYSGMNSFQKLINAIANGDIIVVKQALYREAIIDKIIEGGIYDGCTPLMISIIFNSFDITYFLLENGASINIKRRNIHLPNPEKGQTALSWAAHKGHFELVKILVDRGAEIDVPDHHDSTPFIQAAKSGSIEIMEYLSNLGANINAQISDGRTALSLAARANQFAAVDYLLSLGCDIDHVGNSGFTPLMNAVFEKSHEMAEFLIGKGADVNKALVNLGNYISYNGYTPLAFALLIGDLRLTKLLIENGANISYIVPKGKTWDGKPLKDRKLSEIVRGRNKEKILKLIEKK